MFSGGEMLLLDHGPCVQRFPSSVCAVSVQSGWQQNQTVSSFLCLAISLAKQAAATAEHEREMSEKKKMEETIEQLLRRVSAVSLHAT